MTPRLLSVHAHPDDESSKGAATLAHYRSLGADVMVVSCTGGERGDILNDAVAADPLAKRDIAGLRRREMAAAQAALGVQHRWLGFTDSGMAREDGSLPAGSFAALPLDTAARPLVRLIRRFRPHVLVSYDENGGYPHPDHIRSHDVAVRAAELAADPGHEPELGDAWQVRKRYYDRAFTGERVRTIIEAMLEREPASPRADEWRAMLERFGDRAEPEVTTRVPVGAHFEARDEALRAHASQVAPENPFFFWPNDLLREVWPTEEYQLVASEVETALPETDLFAGIEETDA